MFPWFAPRFSRFCIALACLLLATGLAAQTAPAAANAAPSAPTIQKAETSKEGLVIEKIVTRVRAEEDGTGTRETTARIRIQSEAGVKDMAVLTFTYTASNQQVDIAYVRVIKPDGSMVVTPDYNVQDMPADVSREAPMYSDIHEKHVAVRGLGVGDTLEYDITLNTLKPEVPGQFWMEYSFQKDLIALDEQLDLDVPADKPVTVVSATVQPTATTAGARKLYHWASSNLTRPDPEKPTSTKHWKPSVQVTTFASWEQVGAWYAALQKDRIVVTPAIQAKADALTKGLTSDDDKIRAIFAAVALHIHYVGLSFGIGRYQPHAADDVLANEYGDCKDKHTLLAALLKAAGIEAWPVLIPSSRELDETVPSPAQFDHVITVVPRDGKLIWMDSTAEVAPVGVLVGAVRDKQGLVIPTGKPAYLQRTPAQLPFPQEMRFVADGKISDKGEFTANISQTYHGDAELIMRGAFRQVPQSQWKEFVQRMSGSIGFGGEAQDPVVSPVEHTGAPFHFSYGYTRETFGDWDDRRISPALPGVGWELMPGVRVIKPADDIDIGSPGEQDYISRIQMPEGYMLSPPANVDLKEDWAEYHSTYSFTKGVFSAERRLVLKKEYVPLADWDKYLAFRHAIYADSVVNTPFFFAGTAPETAERYRSSMALTGLFQEMATALQPVRDAVAPLAGDSPPSADELSKSLEACRQAVQEIEEKTLTTAPGDAQSLYFAQELAAAWTGLGWLELERKNAPAAESHLHAAWKLSHDRFAGYEYARALEAQGNDTEAEHILRLAYVGSPGGTPLGLASGMNAIDRIAQEYKKLEHKPISATALNGGRYYDGSLQSELDKDLEKRQYIPSTKVNGQGLYAVAYAQGKPVKATLIEGDKSMTAFIAHLERDPLPSPLPAGSKARLVREVKLICSPFGGCDAYLLLPNAVQMPGSVQTIKAIPANPSKDTKIIHLELPQ